MDPCRNAFERECADWGLDFSYKDDHYTDFNTGVMYGVFMLGWYAGRAEE